MGKYQRMHNVVGFVCNLHEFIKYLSAIFFPSPLVFLSAFYEKLKFTAKFFYDVIISPPSMLPTISPSKDYKKRDWLVVVLLWLFMGKCWIFVMHANEPRKRSDARRTTQKKKSDLLELDALLERSLRALLRNLMLTPTLNIHRFGTWMDVSGRTLSIHDALPSHKFCARWVTPASDTFSDRHK